MAGVAVTSMALWTPYGEGIGAFWNGLITDAACTAPVQRFPVEGNVFRTRTGATIPQISTEMSGDIDRSVRKLVRSVLQDLWSEAQIKPGDLPAESLSVCVGTVQGAASLLQSYVRDNRRAGALDIGCHHDWLNANTLCPFIARETGALGASICVSTACSSGTNAIGTAFNLLAKRRASRVIVAGVGYYTEHTFSGFNILRLLGREGCRPFSDDRDGTLLGDGVAMVLLEDEEFARSRGAPMLARVVGFANRSEAAHPTAPEAGGETGSEAMWSAIGKSQANLNRVGYINAHGTGTVANDESEVNAIRRFLARRESQQPVAVSSTKGHHGHSLGATGVVEFIATILAMRHQIVPCNAGLERSAWDHEEKFFMTRGSACQQHISIALSLSNAFGGNVAAVAVERP